jgi:hypothetical protein
MSDLRGKQIDQADLKAPTGLFRIVMAANTSGKMEGGTRHFLFEDYPNRHDALSIWRKLNHSRDNTDYAFYIFDDHGRIVDAVGAHITDEERKAPPGKFRIICGDTATGTVRLITDLDDRDAAIEYAKNADEGPHTGFQVHDDTGAALISVS